MNSLHGVPTESLKNIKNYFCQYDCITNLKYDVSLSIMPRYLCNAGCKFCYIKNYWEAASADINEIDLGEKYTERLFKFLDQFPLVNCIDNLQLLKTKFPKLFEFYVKNSWRMSYGCLTDNAITQQFDILMEQMTFRGIHEISLTDDFIMKTPDILTKLQSLNKKYNIRMIKFIYTNADKKISEALFFPILEFTQAFDIDVIRHKNVMDDKFHNGIYDLSDTEYHFKPLYAENGKIFHVLGDGAIHIYHETLKFSTDDGASSSLLPGWGTIDDLGYKLIVKLIKGKLEKYKDYVKNMKNTENNVFYDYYKFICEKLVINEDANFIPEFILTWDACFYELLKKDGWISTKYGLIKVKSENEKIKALIYWKKDAV